MENGFFKVSDFQAKEIEGYPINPNWWSRSYEYPWALRYAEAGLVVADMGCGWTPRPFKDALSRICGKVYAVDGDPRAAELLQRERMTFVTADFTSRVEAVPDGILDRIFCISVLEDVADKVPLALQEFARGLKPGGLCVLTFDVQYDLHKPLGQYPGVVLEKFWSAAERSGFVFRDEVNLDKTDVVFNEGFNLCVFHCVLVKV